MGWPKAWGLKCNGKLLSLNEFLALGEVMLPRFSYPNLHLSKPHRAVPAMDYP
jgi:hypothetical protein